jgi:hypothetical protein
MKKHVIFSPKRMEKTLDDALDLAVLFRPEHNMLCLALGFTARTSSHDDLTT